MVKKKERQKKEIKDVCMENKESNVSKTGEV